jgi:hypothetical protein
MNDRGLKLDDGKLRYDLLDDNAEAEKVAVLSYGAVKYEPHNWKHLQDAVDRYYSAFRRHTVARRSGEVLDPETRLHHLAHAACCLDFLLGIELATPEGQALVKTLPERLAYALARAHEIRAQRLGALLIEPPTWLWVATTMKGLVVGEGYTDSRQEAQSDANAALRKRRLKRGKIQLSERSSAGVVAHAPEESVDS